ncbi:MAG: class I SAM-dependent methyltransferase [Actinomycetia bacterium]|nr:class I SAM-dependent methyltransferase [Actinomycetes bacterium]
MDVDVVARLRTAAGRRLLAQASGLLAAGTDTLAATARLRATSTDHELVAAALTQAQLRAAARPRFGPDAEVMLWTRAGLEQATRAVVARHRAARYAALGPHRTADLCCGVGGDLVALARAGLAVLGVDVDPVTAALARANVEELGLGADVEIRADDVTRTDLTGCDAAFLDPARRDRAGRRTFDPAGYAPAWSFVAELAARIPATGVKAAPGFPHALVPAGVEAELVSDAGEVKEAVLWHGPLATPGVHRRATLLPGGASLVDDPAVAAPAVRPAGRWLHEPDGAVVRAGLVAEVAAALDGWLLDPRVAYVCTDHDVGSPFTRRYAVEDVLPFQLKRLRALLRERGVGDVVVKKRASAVDPEDLRRRLRLPGHGPTQTLVLTRVAERPVVLLVRPQP